MAIDCLMLYMEYRLGDYIIFKTSALITVNAGWNPIDIEPFVNYDLGNSKCLLVISNKGLTEFGEGISQHQNILFTIS